ncbi:hypothetical protein BT67DRAFT_190676 [Trichocladium antarcticum]|uniref:Uncharacterized protein n=1 Tax=Trichocladium antarcticum TaxID=1450529 RepID=A0AAN6UQ34_9PEZI|nr:hypothetical protein BT67DRAFT_190676 [Trichocladium antarcticum]
MDACASSHLNRGRDGFFYWSTSAPLRSSPQSARVPKTLFLAPFFFQPFGEKSFRFDKPAVGDPIRGWTTGRHHNSKTHVDPARWFKERETPPRFRGTRTSPGTGRRLLGARSGSGATAGALTEKQEHTICGMYPYGAPGGGCSAEETGTKTVGNIVCVFRGQSHPVVT